MNKTTINKFKACILTILALLSFFTFNNIVNASTITLSSQSSISSTDIGNSFTVTFGYSSDVALGVVHYEVTYDNSKLELTSGDTSDIKIYNGTDKSDSITLTFKALAEGNTTVSFDITEALDMENEQPLTGDYSISKTIEITDSTPNNNTEQQQNIVKHNITFVLNDGVCSNNECDNRQVNDGDKISPITDPTKDNQVFGGWFTDEDFSSPYDFDLEITQDYTLYAKWEDINVSISSSIQSVDFGSTYVGFENHIQKKFTIRNTGNVNIKLTINSPVSEGPFGSLNFENGKVLTPGESYNVTIIGLSGGTNSNKIGTYNGNYVFTATSMDDTKTANVTIPASIKLAERPLGVLYTTHVQYVGWQNYVANGAMAGTSGQSLRLEGIKIKLNDQYYSGNIEYRTHIQNIGWESGFKKNDEMSGTSGQSLRLEAIEIKLTGEISNHYDIYYRVHAQNYGWLGWARNGERSGTAGYAYRLEGIEIKIVKKGEIVSEYGRDYIFHDKNNGSIKPTPDTALIEYTTHVQNIGWQNYSYDGAMAGTSGQSLRLEGIKIKLHNQKYSGDIEYKTHIQNIGWESGFKKNDEMSGTSGQSLRLEAIQIRLTGDMAKYYDVYYRVHAQNFGWLGWARNGESSGTAGYAYRLEGIEIRLVEKGTFFSGYGSTIIFHDKNNGDIRTIGDDKRVSFATYVQNIGWQGYVQDGSVNGTTGRSLSVEAFKAKLINQNYSGDIEYKSYIQNRGWESDFKKNDEMSGTNNQALRMEAIQIRLTGDMANHYDIYYRVHSQNFGWLGWARNGESAGTTGYGYRIEAIEIKIVNKGDGVSGYGSEAAIKDIGGWKNIDGKTYYYYPDGSVAKYFTKIDGVRYEFSSTGELQHSNIKIIADVSYHNGTIDWDTLWNSGEIDEVIFRIGWSIGEDRKFEEYLAAAKRLGIPYSVYHFSIAETAEEAVLEGNYLVKWYKDNDLNTSMGVFYDIEEWHNEDYSHSDATITPEQYDVIIQNYKNTLNANGINMSLYAGKNYAETRLTDYGRSQVTWIAQYNSRCTYLGTYRGWQFSSTEHLPGINGDVDLSVFYY